MKEKKTKANPAKETELKTPAADATSEPVEAEAAKTTETPETVAAETAEMPEPVAAETAETSETVAAETAEAPASVATETAETPETVTAETAETPESVAAETAEAPEVAEEGEEESKSLSDRAKIISPGKLVLKRFFRSKLSIIGLVIIVFLFALSFIGPLFSPYGETEPDMGGGSREAIITEITYTVVNDEGETESYTIYDITYTQGDVNRLAYPSAKHWFGTDDQGHDVLTRLMYGGRISLAIGFIVVFLETIIGVIMGGLAGYFGKWVDMIIMRIVDIFSCVPSLPILLIASALIEANDVPPKYQIYFLMVILTIFGWSGTARVVRGQILSLREQEYMTAATAAGLSPWRKIFTHLIPNVLPQLIVSMTLGLGGVILMESSLSFLGLGVPFPYAAWGSMIGRIEEFNILVNHFHLWGPPGFCIMLAVLGFNFIGDGLRDAFDPKMKR